MITNGASDTQREKLGVTGIERVFAAIFISAEVGIVKPDPAIFHLALDKLSVGADAAVYVGDYLHHDVAGGEGSRYHCRLAQSRRPAAPA